MKSKVFFIQSKTRSIHKNRKWRSWDRENKIFVQMTKMGSIIGHRIDCNGVGALRGQRHIPTNINPSTPPPPPRAWKFYMVLSAAPPWEAKQLPPQSPRPRPPYFDLLFSAPNQNRHATQASVYFCTVCPSNPKGSPGRRFETLNTEPS